MYKNHIHAEYTTMKNEVFCLIDCFDCALCYLFIFGKRRTIRSDIEVRVTRVKDLGGRG